jgi:NMD protein affecting ribosome stability and mRNA decay
VARALRFENRKGEVIKSNKRYTNATYTKRVDHEAGQHHTPRNQTEPAVCTECNAVYRNRRWVQDVPKTVKPPEPWQSARMVVCPACKQKNEGVFGGYVEIDGAFYNAHHDEIEKLLKNEAMRISEKNPLAQIMKLERGKNKLTITTTTEHLAQRLGRALQKAYCGDVEYDFSDENKLARVKWHRE